MNKSKKGSTLVLVVIVFAVVMILGTGFVTQASWSNKYSQRQYEKQEAYYIAKSALDTLIHVFENDSHKADLLIEQKQGEITGIWDDKNCMYEVKSEEANQIRLKVTVMDKKRSAVLSTVEGVLESVSSDFALSIDAKHQVTIGGSRGNSSVEINNVYMNVDNKGHAIIIDGNSGNLTIVDSIISTEKKMEISHKVGKIKVMGMTQLPSKLTVYGTMEDMRPKKESITSYESNKEVKIVSDGNSISVEPNNTGVSGKIDKKEIIISGTNVTDVTLILDIKDEKKQNTVIIKDLSGWIYIKGKIEASSVEVTNCSPAMLGGTANRGEEAVYKLVKYE